MAVAAGWFEIHYAPEVSGMKGEDKGIGEGDKEGSDIS